MSNELLCVAACTVLWPNYWRRNSANDERQLKAVMEFRKAYSAQALEGSNIPKVMVVGYHNYS